MAGKSKEMELAIKIAGKIDKSFNTAIANVNKSIRGATKAIAVGAAAAAAAVGAVTFKAVEVGKEFEASMSQVAATLRLNTATEEGAAQMAILEEAARQCGRETAFSASEAAEGLNNLAMAGYSAAESATALPTVLALAGAGQIEMADSSRYLTATMGALGLDRTSENFQHLADVMALTASKAQTDVPQIGEAFTALGGNGRALQGGVDEIAAALGALANWDITGSEAGTHLRNIISSLQNPRNKNAAAMFEQLGVNAYDAQGQMRQLNDIFGDLNTAMGGMTDEQRNSVIKTLFKETDKNAALALLAQCGEGFDDLYQSAQNASDGIGAAQEMYNRQTDNLKGDIDIFKSALTEVGISIYENLMPGLRDGVQFATSLVTIFGEGLANGDVMGGIGGVIDAVVEKLGQMPESIKQVAAAIAAIGGVNLLGTFLDSGVWNGGVQAVQGFGKAITNTHIKIPKLFTSAGRSVLGFLSPLSNIKSAWNTVFGDSLLNKIVGRVGTLGGKVGGAIGKVGGVILNVGGKLASGLTSMMGMALKMLMPAALIGGLLVGLGLINERFGDQISALLATAREKGPQIIQNIVTGITSRIPSLLASGARLVTDLLNTIGALAPSLVMGGAQIIMSLVNGVAQNAPMMISGAINAIGGFASGILQALPALIMCGMNLMLSLLQGIVQNLPNMIQGAIAAITAFVQGMASYFPQILQVAAQIIMTLVSGIASALPMILQGAISILGTLGQGIISNLPLIIQTGVQVIAAIITGIISTVGTLGSVAVDVAGQLWEAFKNIDWLALGGDIITGIGNGIKSGVGGIVSGIGDFITGGGKEEQTSTPTAAPAPALPPASTYTSAGQQGAAAYASGFMSGLPQISAATTSITDIFGTAGANGGVAFTGSLTGSLGAGFDLASAANIDTAGIADIFGTAGITGGETFTTALDSGLSGYQFDPSSIGLNMSGLSADLSEAASTGGDAFTSGLDGALAGYSFDTSSIGVDSAALTSAMTAAGTEGGTSFVDALTASLGSGFDLASAANIDTSSITATMQTAGNAGGQAFTSALTSSMSVFNFNPSTLGVNPPMMQSAMSPAGTAGGQALTSSLQSSINAGYGAVVGAAQRIGNGVSSAIQSGFSKAKSSAASAMASIKNTCSSGAKAAASAVKHAFEHMSIKIPRPKIPVVHVSTRTATVGTQTVSYPSFSISYHALGGIFTKAMMMQDAMGNRHVMGEAGPEALIPLDTMWTRMEEIMRRVMQGDGSVVSELLAKLQAPATVSPAPAPIGAGGMGGNIYFSPTYNLYGTATRQDAERAGKATFEEFKKFMAQYEKDKRRTRF